MKLILRAALGGLLGIFVGENPIALGLLSSSIFLPMLVWYIFLFLTFDWLIVRFKLSDRSFTVLNAILAILIGGILDKEFFTPRPEMGFLGLDIFSMLLNTFWWGASFTLLFHFINILIPRGKIILGGWAVVIFFFSTLLLMGPALPVILISVNPTGFILLLILSGILFIKLVKMIKISKQDARPVIQKSLKLSLILLIFIVLSIIFGPQGYIILSGIVVLIVLLLMLRYRISI